MQRDHSSCRACGSSNLVRVFDLGVQPLANDFRNPGEMRNGFYPLKVLFCRDCSLAQLSVVVDPSVLYDNYPYVTSDSETMRQHFNTLRSDIVSEGGCGPLLEIGSNDGLFLSYMQQNGFTTALGIDPAANLATAASRRGVKTISALFDEESAKDAVRAIGQVNTIVARHVFAHTDDWKQFVRCVELISNPNTLVCIEVPYCGNLLSRCEWDTIYHEHLSYVTVKSMAALLRDSDFHLHRIIQYPVHGGAMLFMLRHNDHESIRHVSVDEWLAKESIGLDEWKAFEVASMRQINELGVYVHKLNSEGKTVCGFGASAKSTVAINAAHLCHHTIDFITDTTPQKQGRLSPGSMIPIVPQERLLETMPNYAVCFAWNYREEILRRNEEYRKRGGKFIFFVPKLEVV